jgi:hypothetical protein
MLPMVENSVFVIPACVAMDASREMVRPPAPDASRVCRLGLPLRRFFFTALRAA